VLDTILQFLYTVLAGTVGAAVELAVSRLHAMADDHAAAVGTFGRQRMDRALKAIEYMPLVPYHHGKRFVIFVSTDFTSGHLISFL
jgi:hypothetical protein